MSKVLDEARIWLDRQKGYLSDSETEEYEKWAEDVNSRWRDELGIPWNYPELELQIVSSQNSEMSITGNFEVWFYKGRYLVLECSWDKESELVEWFKKAIELGSKGYIE